MIVRQYRGCKSREYNGNTYQYWETIVVHIFLQVSTIFSGSHFTFRYVCLIFKINWKTYKIFIKEMLNINFISLQVKSRKFVFWRLWNHIHPFLFVLFSFDLNIYFCIEVMVRDVGEISLRRRRAGKWTNLAAKRERTLQISFPLWFVLSWLLKRLFRVEAFCRFIPSIRIHLSLAQSSSYC